VEKAPGVYWGCLTNLSGFPIDTLNADEYKSLNNELMMIRYVFTSGKVHREGEVNELLGISITFRPGEIR
jgi:hypothetical protein